MAFQLLSSLALFVAATFQAASQRPSVLSACFLALFGAERMATSVAPVTQHALLTRTQLSIWRRALVLSMFAIAGECVVQGLYVSLGPHWPRSAAGARALRWLGFAELDGASAYLADFFPFFALACFASAQLFLHRVAAAEVAALTIGLPGTRVGAHATEADISPSRLTLYERALAETSEPCAASGDDARRVRCVERTTGTRAARSRLSALAVT